MPDRHWLLSPRVWIRTYQPILGDPGGDSGGDGEAKRAENRPFRLSLAPTISPWVSEDEVIRKQAILQSQVETRLELTLFWYHPSCFIM